MRLSTAPSTLQSISASASSFSLFRKECNRANTRTFVTARNRNHVFATAYPRSLTGGCWPKTVKPHYYQCGAMVNSSSTSIIRTHTLETLAAADFYTTRQQQQVWQWKDLSSVALVVTSTLCFLLYQQPSSEHDVVKTTALESPSRAVKSTQQQMSDSVCDLNVSIWQRNGRTIYLMGCDTSERSTDLAGNLVQEVRPQAVFVELDLKSVILGMVGGIFFIQPSPSTNFSTGNTPNASLAPAVPQVRSNAGPLPLVGLPPQKVLVPMDPSLVAITDRNETSATTTSKLDKLRITKVSFHPVPSFQGFDLHKWNYLNERFFQHTYSVKTENSHPRGPAFIHALQQGLNVDATIVLGDVDAERTRRESNLAWRNTDWTLPMDEWRMLQKVLHSDDIITSTDKGSSSSSNSIEALETTRRMVKLLKQFAPSVYQVLLEDRDEFMAAGLDSLKQFNTIVAVTGTVHVLGVARHLLDRGWKPVPKSCPILHQAQE